jgi:hypothetical protein
MYGMDCIIAIVSVAWWSILQTDFGEPSTVDQLAQKEKQIVVFVFAVVVGMQDQHISSPANMITVFYFP